MTVEELIAQLSKLPPTSLVVLQKDGEGNGYSPCVGVEAATYAAESTWSGEVPHPDDADNYPDAVPCVVLWPVN